MTSISAKAPADKCLAKPSTVAISRFPRSAWTAASKTAGGREGRSVNCAVRRGHGPEAGLCSFARCRRDRFRVRLSRVIIRDNAQKAASLMGYYRRVAIAPVLIHRMPASVDQLFGWRANAGLSWLWRGCWPFGSIRETDKNRPILYDSSKLSSSPISRFWATRFAWRFRWALLRFAAAAARVAATVFRCRSNARILYGSTPRSAVLFGNCAGTTPAIAAAWLVRP